MSSVFYRETAKTGLTHAVVQTGVTPPETFNPSNVGIPFDTPMGAHTMGAQAAVTVTVDVDMDGVWTWFSDERVIEIADDTYAVGAVSSGGVVRVGEYGLTQRGVVDIRTMGIDDHYSPALLKRSSDSKIMCFVPGRNSGEYYIAVSSAANDVSAFDAEVSIAADLGHGSLGYAVAHQLDSGRIPLFYRATNTTTSAFAWHCSYSDDDGANWTTGVQLTGNNRPYPKIRKTAGNRIDFLINDGHPNAVPTNSVYHFYMLDTAGTITWHKSDGTDITANIPFTPADDFTLIYDGTTERAWVSDLQVDSAGRPVATFTVYMDADPGPVTDIRAYQARFNGTTWSTEEICTMGDSPVDAGEEYYSGGICGMPGNEDVVFVGRRVDGSGNIDISTGVHQIFKADRSSGSWVLTQITSTADESIRPFVPQGTADQLFYVEGNYVGGLNYDMEVRKVTA